MKVCSLKDFETVYTFFTREDFVGDITDDFSPHIFDVVKNMLSHDLVCMPTENTAFVFRPVNSILYEAHFNTTEEDKDNKYVNFFTMMKWLKDNTSACSILAYIPVTYKSTLYFASKVGMEQAGVIKNGFLKNGSFVDNIIVFANVEDTIKELSWLSQ